MEPLSAYYATNVLDEIRKAIDNEDFKLINLLNNVRFKSVLMDRFTPFYDKYSFLNINRPEDLTAAEKIILTNE
ncbi:molybdopterin-guanine dinucleotide biosynthesis protein MobA [compost metagenome]